jgi:hypothetical protein
VVHPCFAPRSFNSPSSIKKEEEEEEERNSSHTKERNKRKKTIVPVVEGCEEHTCMDLGVEDDHHSGIRSILFEHWIKLDMDNFHTF